MKRWTLAGSWRLIERPAEAAPPRQLVLPDPAREAALPVTVPGDVNAALLAAGKIPDPHWDTQARGCYWVTARDWWYVLDFDAPPAGAPLRLGLDEVDGTADVWLNGAFLGTVANAFRPHALPLPAPPRATGNRLHVRFRSIDGLLGGPRLDELRGWLGRRAFLRKVQFNFGWDWALPLPSIGLGAAPWLEAGWEEALTDLALRTFTDGRVDLFFEVGPEARRRGYDLAVRVHGHGADVSAHLRPDSYKSYLSLAIPQPRLWWPNGYGQPALYDYEVTLRVAGQVAHRRLGRLGLRELALREQPWPAELGRGLSFELLVNGQPIFCKGGNWIPPELWPATARDEQYRHYLARAAQAHFTMLRVWGGGLYERELFYDLCDELGLLVWQDFMFAGAAYPLDRLRDEIAAEASHQVRRLHRHPSVAIWCGCNEDVFSWAHPLDQRATAQTDDLDGPGANPWAVNRLHDDPQLYSMILRGTVGLLGMGTPYIESSPASRDDFGNCPNSGNCHISAWKYALFETAGHYDRWRGHFERACAFDSEFCDQGPPAQATFRRFLAPENLWPPNDAWVYHIQRGHGNLPHHEQTLRIAGATFGPIDSLADYVKFGQATHAEMMRAEFESARRDRPYNGGTMMWMFNDCWPTANWSILDYFRRPKPSYYAARRACAPLLPMIVARAGAAGFFLGNDTLGPVAVEAVYGLASLDGQVRWQRRVAVTAAANATTRLGAADVPPAPPGGPTGDYFFLDAVVDGRALEPVCYFPHGWRGIDWPEPTLRLAVLDQGPADGPAGAPPAWLTRLKLTTDRFARFAHVRGPDADDGVSFSDNYFDLPAGRSREILVHSAAAIDPSRLACGHWRTEWE